MMMDWDNHKNWQILLVEDEPDNLEVIAETLHYYGIAVKTAQNGFEGLEVLRDFIPTLILLDLSMPKMDGWEMQKRVKSDPKTQNIPVIALTAHAMSGDKEQALAVGFDGYLTKPISIPNFLKDLRVALEGEQPLSPLPDLPQGSSDTANQIVEAKL